MNNTNTEASNEILDSEISALAAHAPQEQPFPNDDDYSDDSYGVTRDDDTTDGDDCSEFDGEPEPREDHFRDDVDADADTLASAGYGTDEDYGYFGGEDY
jgi:hypothetical protein